MLRFVLWQVFGWDGQLTDHLGFLQANSTQNLPLPRDGHPLFQGFIAAASAYQKQQKGSQVMDSVQIQVASLKVANNAPMTLFGGMNVLESRDMACMLPKPMLR